MAIALVGWVSVPVQATWHKPVAEDSSFKSFATVAAWLHDMDSLNALFGEETVQHRMEIGQAAREQYDRTGEIAYVPAYSQGVAVLRCLAMSAITAVRIEV